MPLPVISQRRLLSSVFELKEGAGWDWQLKKIKKKEIKKVAFIREV
jgi:hypothetical protein